MIQLSKTDVNMRLSSIDKIDLRVAITNAVSYLFDYFGQTTDRSKVVTYEIMEFIEKDTRMNVGQLLSAFNSIKESEISRLNPKIIIDRVKRYRSQDFKADTHKEPEYLNCISFDAFRKSEEAKGVDFRTEYPNLTIWLTDKNLTIGKKYKSHAFVTRSNDDDDDDLLDQML